jgi:transcriptional/translational regulatory protein YebC/TACO1
MVPQNTIKLEGAAANQMLKLYDSLDDHDDVQNVSSNFEVDDDLLAGA